jgi:glycosyltransferase involved in cell wall biosynthesis
MTRYRLAAVASHPVQYQAPWYRALARVVDLQVFFAHRATPADQAGGGFGVAFDWDVPLLDGYAHAWLTNCASRPSVDAFWGCNTPDIGERLQRGRFDAVLVNGWQLFSYWQAVRAARRAGIATLVRGDSRLAAAGAARGAAKRLVYPRLLDCFDVCLAVGDRSADYYRHYGVPEARIVRSPHCVDNVRFAMEAAAARPRSAARLALGLPAEAIVFAFVGKLVEKKRTLDYLTALDTASRGDARVYGLVVGDGPLRPALEAHVRARATPCVLGGFHNQRAIAHAYGAADALVLPSDARETWGLVVNEAMACGLPAIVSDAVGCAPDLIVEGQTGFTYACGDVAALAGLMARVAADEGLRARMSRQAAAHITQFSPEAAAAGVVTALERARPRPQSRHGMEPTHVFDAVS